MVTAAARFGARAGLHRHERAWARSVRQYLRIDLDMAGLDVVDPERAYLVTALHEGFADALALVELPLDLVWVVRDELREWPTLGRYLTAGRQIVAVEGGSVAAHRSLFRQVGKRLTSGESVVLFPQGTILGIETAFRPGLVHLARRFGVEVLPVVLTGSHRVWEFPYTPVLRFGQRVSMRVLPPVVPDELNLAVLQRRMKQAALDPSTAEPRHFVPERDGYWDGYAYEIDPAFPELRREVDGHRAERAQLG
jgi:1-acyl-sn-glycerol-3-phosphate acyltransferase